MCFSLFFKAQDEDARNKESPNKSKVKENIRLNDEKVSEIFANLIINFVVWTNKFLKKLFD